MKWNTLTFIGELLSVTSRARKNFVTFDSFRKVVDLKFRLEKLFKQPASKMRLFYVDHNYRDLTAPEEMKYPNKQLYSYNIATGDEIIVELKKRTLSETQGTSA